MLQAARTRGSTAALVVAAAVFCLWGAARGAQIEAAGEAAITSQVQTVVVIPLEGDVDEGLFDSVKRRIAESVEFSPVLIVFRIDTYGGLVNAAIEITNEIGGVENVKTVAYVPTKAYSAGAMLAMGAREIVLTEHSSIGDAAPILATGPEGPQLLGEKFQSPVRNMFRKYAQRNGYPEAIVEAMVTPELEIVEVTFKDGSKQYMRSESFEELDEAAKGNVEGKRVVVREGDLLTATAQEAKEYGITRFVVKDFGELLGKYGLSGARVVELEVNWSEALVRFLNKPALAAILLLVGMLGLYMEFKIPGFGLPGTVGIICLATLLLSKYLSGMAQYWEVLVFVVGVLLLGLEIFVIPGFGVAGIAGITLVVVGLVFSLVPPDLTPAPLDVTFLAKTGGYFVAALVLAFVIAVLLAKILPKAPVVGKFFLGEPLPETVSHSAGAGLTEGRGDLVGKAGKAFTQLRPAGRAIIDGEYYDVTTRGELIEKGALVEVVRMRGNNIVVKELR